MALDLGHSILKWWFNDTKWCRWLVFHTNFHGLLSNKLYLNAFNFLDNQTGEPGLFSEFPRTHILLPENQLHGQLTAY